MYKILKIIAAILSLVGIIFCVMVIAKGDEAIKAGETSSVDGMAFVTYIVFGIALFFVLLFVIKNLFTNTASLKNTLMGVGAFILVLLIAYFVSGGDGNVYKYNGEAVTAGESQMVGAGLIAFYILIIAAALSMVFAGVKKMTT